MDFNYFYHREQVERMRADAAVSVAARSAHQNLAEAYGLVIAKGRAERRAPFIARTAAR